MVQLLESVGHEPPFHMYTCILSNAQSSDASHRTLNDAAVPDEYVQVPLHLSLFELTQADPLQLYVSPKNDLVTVTVHKVLVTVVPTELI